MLSALQGSRPGRRTREGRSWCGELSTGSALDVLHTALREYRTQQCRYETAEVYDLMSNCASRIRGQRSSSCTRGHRANI